ncbi:hypothetical protein VPH35_046044 [Triticum aestivum]
MDSKFRGNIGNKAYQRKCSNLAMPMPETINKLIDKVCKSTILKGCSVQYCHRLQLQPARRTQQEYHRRRYPRRPCRRLLRRQPMNQMPQRPAARASVSSFRAGSRAPWRASRAPRAGRSGRRARRRGLTPARRRSPRRQRAGGR